MLEITICANYSDFDNIFLFNSIVKLLKYISIDNYFINLIDNN